MKSLAQKVDDVIRLKAADGLTPREVDFLNNVDVRTRADRVLGRPLNLTGRQVEWVEDIWDKHFGRS